MKTSGIGIVDLSKTLDVSPSQIYKWNREGISINCKHYLRLKEILPNLEPREILLTKDGKEDQRFRAGRKKKDLIKISDLEDSGQKENLRSHKSTLFPTIHFNNKTT